MEPMNDGYFMAGNVVGGSGMMSAGVTPFHLEHGGLGFAIGGAAELGAHFAVNNVMLASFANQLSVPVRPQDGHRRPGTPPEEEEMDCGFDVAAGGDSCSAASLQCPGQSAGGTAVWSSSSNKTPYGDWSGASDPSRTVSIQEPDLTGIPDAACFPFPPATNDLSLTLFSKSSSESGPNATDQCSSVASRSALTELTQASCYPRARSTQAPFAVVVARSPYAAVAQEVLNDIVGRLLDGVATTYSGSGIDSGARPPIRSVDASSVVSSNRLVASSEDAGCARWGEAQRARSDLLNMLQMVDQKYNQCLDEVQSTTAKFNGLMMHQQGGRVGNGNASICAPFAHRAVAGMYRGLRQRIAGEIMAARRPTCWGESSSDVERSWESALIQKHWATTQKTRRGEQQCCWRPQRGLPERSVTVLKDWMFEHFLKPYPDDHEKDMLAARSGLTRNQVSNWFINARVRIWKPMIEEMYQDLKRSSAGELEPAGDGATAEREQRNMLSA